MAPTVQLLLQHLCGHGESGGGIEAFCKKCVAAFIKADMLHEIHKGDHLRRQLSFFIGGKRVFAVEYKGKAIGSLGIEEYREKYYPELDALQGREIGYVLSKDYWGQGLMPEAVKAVIDWLFYEVGLDFIMVGHFDWNCQSRLAHQRDSRKAVSFFVSRYWLKR